MRPLTSMSTKVEAAISFASKIALACGVKRTWIKTGSVRSFRQAIGALLTPTAAHASRLGVLQTGALRAGEASAAGTGVRESEGTRVTPATILVSKAWTTPR
jgi:hypothetical protein